MHNPKTKHINRLIHCNSSACQIDFNFSRAQKYNNTRIEIEAKNVQKTWFCTGIKSDVIQATLLMIGFVYEVIHFKGCCICYNSNENQKKFTICSSFKRSIYLVNLLFNNQLRKLFITHYLIF